MYSQDSKDKALGMLRLTGDVEKTARMSGVPGRTLRRWAAAAAKPRQRSRGAKFEPYGDEVRGKAMEMARGGASCREIAEALGIGSPDVVRYWLKGGGTKEARMGGRARTPEGDEPAYAGFEGGLEERIRQLELENDILRGAVDLLKAGSLGSMSNMEKTALIDKLRLESDRPLRELTDSLGSRRAPMSTAARSCARRTGTPSSGPTSGGYSTAPAAGAATDTCTTSCGKAASSSARRSCAG